MSIGVVGAVGADPPIGHLRRRHRKAVGNARGETRRVPDSTVDVLDGATARAHEVVMVVADAKFKHHRVPGRFDPAHQARSGEVAESVVDRLQADGIQRIVQVLSAGVRTCTQCHKNRASRFGDAQAGGAQGAVDV